MFAVRILFRRPERVVSVVGPAAGENRHARVSRSGHRPCGPFSRLAIPRVRQSIAGVRRGRRLAALDGGVVVVVVAATSRSAVQIFVRVAVEHHERLVPVRGSEVRQLSHAGAGQIVQNHSGHADGQNCVAQHPVRVLRIFDGGPDIAGHGVLSAGQCRRCGASHIDHNDGRRAAADAVLGVGQFHRQLAGRSVPRAPDDAGADDVRRQRVQCAIHGRVAGAARRFR